MRILLLSAYDAHSHRRWRIGLVAAFPDWQWTVLTLPPRHFSWRVRGNSLSWAFSEQVTLEQSYDLVIATSMTDLSALKGLVPALAAIPSLVYCHENQFAYPDRREQDRIEPKFSSLYAMLSADWVVFNSNYNRNSCLAGAQALLDKMPDAVPPGVVDSLAEKSCVLPVPLEQSWYSNRTVATGVRQPFTIVWNHRWEYDKAPDRMFDALLELQEAGESFKVHVIGQSFRRQPPEFEAMLPLLQAHIGEYGHIESDDEYQQLLQGSQIVLSTALHEFQGLAVLEAVACGCVPLVPDRLAYAEFIPDDCRYTSSSQDGAAESRIIASHLQTLCKQYQQDALPQAPDVEWLSWQQQAPRYRELIDELT